MSIDQVYSDRDFQTSWRVRFNNVVQARDFPSREEAEAYLARLQNHREEAAKRAAEALRAEMEAQWGGKTPSRGRHISGSMA